MKTIAFTICTVNKKVAKCTFVSCGEANGYVAVPPEHPLYGKDYDDVDNIDVRGGLTFSDKIDFTTIPVEDVEFISDVKEVPSDWWVFGFDTFHLGDNRDNWSKERVIEETLHLQEQLEKMSFDEIARSEQGRAEKVRGERGLKIMTRNFTTPCFIRKNTPELRKKLEELGYKPSMVIFDNKQLCIATAVNREYAKYTNITNEMFDSNNLHETWNCAGRIDCGTDENLFLAIAALREDSDYMQFFTNGTEFILCDKESWLDGKIPDLIHKHDLSIAVVGLLYNYHKATVEELIEHFKGE